MRQMSGKLTLRIKGEREAMQAAELIDFFRLA
jgi:hypothetical protein